MKPIEFENGDVQIDASVIADGLGITLPLLQQADARGQASRAFPSAGSMPISGRHRLTFFSEHRRFRVVVDDSGAIIQRSALDFGDVSLPKSVAEARRIEPLLRAGI